MRTALHNSPPAAVSFSISGGAILGGRQVKLNRYLSLLAQSTAPQVIRLGERGGVRCSNYSSTTGKAARHFRREALAACGGLNAPHPRTESTSRSGRRDRHHVLPMPTPVHVADRHERLPTHHAQLLGTHQVAEGRLGAAPLARPRRTHTALVIGPYGVTASPSRAAPRSRLRGFSSRGSRVHSDARRARA